LWQCAVEKIVVDSPKQRSINVTMLVAFTLADDYRKVKLAGNDGN
jgi:hypothetical protein